MGMEGEKTTKVLKINLINPAIQLLTSHVVSCEINYH